MRILRGRALVVAIALLLATGTGVAQTAGDFYLNLLRRGVADFNAGRYDAAADELRIAAFGLLESVEHFQTAQIYIAVASDKLGREADARKAAQRVLAAERLQPRYAALSLPADVRGGFQSVSRKLLTSEELAVLEGTPAPQSVPPPRIATPAPATTQPSTATITPAQPQTSGTNGNDGVREEPIPPPTTATRPQTTTPAQPKTTTAPTRPQTADAPRATPPAPPPVNVVSRLATAEAAIGRSDLTAARAIFTEVLAMASLDHATLLRVAEGAYRARDFRNAVRAFERAGTLRGGEEPYRYYLAVALYELGEYRSAKRELAAALPYIELTPHVESYRRRIEGAAD